jgi:predicted RNA binding protein YcfA (HicA-like mRNA interferase family)
VADLPAVSARKLIRALKRAGFVEDRQRGSHLILWNADRKSRTVVPIHAGKTIKKPLLRAILRDANLSIDQFVELL